MSNDPNDIKFKKWLDVLQQESWQLELIISGFAIYGLFMVYEPVEFGFQKSQMQDNIYRAFLFQSLLISWYVLTINLVIHVVLRGLWIGAIGLRYVSGEIDYDKLKYSPKFKDHLLRRVGSFDSYVATLERYCSVIFAVTFILVFYLLGFFVIIFSIVLISLITQNANLSWAVKISIATPLLLFIAIGSLFTFIDFLTQGWMKKKKWTSKIYYPFYWVFKYLTLSVLYRPMIYNFLDSRFGRKVSFFVVPVYIGLAVLAATKFNVSNYLRTDLTSSESVANRNTYLDTAMEDKLFVKNAAIPSRLINDPYLPVFIAFGSAVEDDLFYFNPELKPENDRRGLFSPFFQEDLAPSKEREILKKYISKLEELYFLKIDEQKFVPEFIITQAGNEQIGYESVLALDSITKGKHLLEVHRKDHRRDSIYYRKIVSIPFWYYPG